MNEAKTKEEKSGYESEKAPYAGFELVNGIKMYYEIHGQGKNLVMIHGGGSTIQTSFGNIIPHLAKHFRVVAMDLQNHGRSGFREEAQTFEQDAEDIAALLKKLEINGAVILGFSNGATTALHLASKYPGLVDKLVLISGAYKRDGFFPGFFESMQHATLDQMPAGLKNAFRALGNPEEKLQTMFEKDRDRMIGFTDIEESIISSINKPALIINADRDVVISEHALEMSKKIKNSRLAILPGAHGKIIGESITLENETFDPGILLSLLEEFLA
jgi:pimeloyl-ACP methyl ester carboxylesterase